MSMVKTMALIPDDGLEFVRWEEEVREKELLGNFFMTLLNLTGYVYSLNNAGMESRYSNEKQV